MCNVIKQLCAMLLKNYVQCYKTIMCNVIKQLWAML